MTGMTRLLPVLLATLLSGCVIKVNTNGEHGDVSKVMGSIQLEPGQFAGDLESVNGGVNLRKGSKAHRVETVNGSIKAHDDVSVYSLETVNGSIRGDENLRVEGEVKTVNGSIEFGNDSVIGRHVSNVNGSILLERTRIAGDITTVNGDVTLRNGSVVEGDVVFRDRRIRHGWDSKPPILLVDSDSAINGTVHLYQEVRLDIDEGAAVGKIIRHYERYRR